MDERAEGGRVAAVITGGAGTPGGTGSQIERRGWLRVCVVVGVCVLGGGSDRQTGGSYMVDVLKVTFSDHFWTHMTKF